MDETRGQARQVPLCTCPMAIGLVDSVPDILGVIKTGIQQKKGKGVRRLTALVDTYLRLVAGAEEDGTLTDAEAILLQGIADRIVAQCERLSG